MLHVKIIFRKRWKILHSSKWWYKLHFTIDSALQAIIENCSLLPLPGDFSIPTALWPNVWRLLHLEHKKPFYIREAKDVSLHKKLLHYHRLGPDKWRLFHLKRKKLRHYYRLSEMYTLFHIKHNRALVLEGTLLWSHLCWICSISSNLMPITPAFATIPSNAHGVIHQEMFQSNEKCNRLYVCLIIIKYAVSRI